MDGCLRVIHMNNIPLNTLIYIYKRTFCIECLISISISNLKSLGPIDRKFHGHGKNDEFVLYEYIIKQCSSFC